MREILFRGKQKDNGEWVEGFYTRVADMHYIVSGIFDSLTNGIINTQGYKVTPETVCQFTGLCDKNGRKIFEGDIVNFYNGDGEFSPYEVRWQDSGFSVLMNGDHDLFDVLDDFFSRHCEINGNIYDNPELLEVKQNEM